MNPELNKELLESPLSSENNMHRGEMIKDIVPSAIRGVLYDLVKKDGALTRDTIAILILNSNKLRSEISYEKISAFYELIEDARVIIDSSEQINGVALTLADALNNCSPEF